MTDATSIARAIGWALAFLGTCLILYPVFSFFARLGGRGLDRTFAGTYVVTGGVLHLPLFVLLGVVVVFAGFHIRGWVTCREQRDAESSGGQQ